MTAELRFALEESNRVCKVPNYFGYTDAKLHAWETLPTRNDQLLAVLAIEPEEISGDLQGYEIEQAYGYNNALRDIRQAIKEAGA